VTKKTVLILALVALFGAAGASAQSNESVTVKGHQLGETFAEFAAKEPTVAQDFKECSERKGYGVWAFTCQDPEVAKKALSSSDRTDPFVCPFAASVVAHFNGGKLVYVSGELKAEYSEIAAEVMKRLGEPGKETLTEKQNLMGAKWIVRQRVWTVGDTFASLVDDPTNKARVLTVSSREEVEREMQAAKTAKKNPLE